MAKFYSTKTYGTDRGLSCCFRQWRATHSHCRLLHGYSIGVKLVFECDELDARNWCYDFGGLKEFKGWLEYMFDHTTLIAKDDPHLQTFKELYRMGNLLELREVDGVGCEKFAEFVLKTADTFVDELTDGRVRVKSVQINEHDSNFATCYNTLDTARDELVVTISDGVTPPESVTTNEVDPPAEQAPAGRAASVGNKVTKGKGNWFEGTSWG